MDLDLIPEFEIYRFGSIRVGSAVLLLSLRRLETLSVGRTKQRTLYNNDTIQSVISFITTSVSRTHHRSGYSFFHFPASFYLHYLPNPLPIPTPSLALAPTPALTPDPRAALALELIRAPERREGAVERVAERPVADLVDVPLEEGVDDDLAAVGRLEQHVPVPVGPVQGHGLQEGHEHDVEVEPPRGVEAAHEPLPHRRERQVVDPRRVRPLVLHVQRLAEGREQLEVLGRGADVPSHCVGRGTGVSKNARV